VTTPTFVTLPVVSGTRASVGEVTVPASVLTGPVREPLLHEMVKSQLASRRAGTHSTKTRHFVSGGGKKPWRQKGTGRARQGSTRATQWKGGGKPFGPTPRSYDQDMPRAMRRGALRDAVTAKINDGEVSVVDALGAVDGKTKSLLARLTAFGVKPVPTLLVVSEIDEPLQRASRNVPWLTVERPGHVSVYELLRARQIVFERAGLAALEEALGS
jgi:large subunit ribosomal protein L4